MTTKKPTPTPKPVGRIVSVLQLPDGYTYRLDEDGGLVVTDDVGGETDVTSNLAESIALHAWLGRAIEEYRKDTTNE